MPRYTFMVLSNPTEGKEEEYQKWYVERHIPDCMRVPGFVSGTLLPAAQQQFRPDLAQRWKYLALFDIETDDLATTYAELGRRLGTDEMPMTDAFNLEGMHVEAFAWPSRAKR